jgi:hypothetical protein
MLINRSFIIKYVIHSETRNLQLNSVKLPEGYEWTVCGGLLMDTYKTHDSFSQYLVYICVFCHASFLHHTKKSEIKYCVSKSTDTMKMYRIDCT